MREVEQFLFREGRLLDEGHFEEWLALYSDDSTYWVPATWNQKSPHDQVSIYYEDKRLLRARVERLRHPRTENMIPAPRTLHHITNVTLEEGDPSSECLVYSTLTVVESRFGMPAQDRRFSGHCRHRLRGGPHGLTIVRKRFDLLDCDRDDGFVRMTIPF